MPEPDTTPDDDDILADLIARCPEHGTSTEAWPECRCAAAWEAAAWLAAHPEPKPPSGLRGQYAAAIDAVTGGTCPSDIIDAVLAIRDQEMVALRAQVELLQRGAVERSDILEEARDALAEAGQNGAHGDDWPAVAPGVRALADRAAAAERRAQAVAKTARAEIRRRRDAEVIVQDLTDPDPCWYDHHGYCQAHGWFATDPACPHARAKALLTPPALGDHSGEGQ